METVTLELHTAVDFALPAGIKVMGQTVGPSYQSDRDGDWVDYSGHYMGHEWEIHIEADGESLYVRACVDDEYIHEDIFRVPSHSSIHAIDRERDVVTAEYVQHVADLVNAVLRLMT